jgi:phosphatidylethanolamine N-methyltransferase
LDILNLSLLGLQLVLFYVLPRPAAKVFFLFYFAFWRAAYDAGLGWVLTKQSKKKWMVREVQRLGWLDENRNPAARDWIRAQLQGKMGKDYSFDVSNLLIPVKWIICLSRSLTAQQLPLEYNTWLLFRQLVDVILLKSVLSSCQRSVTDMAASVTSWLTVCLPLRASECPKDSHFLSMS